MKRKSLLFLLVIVCNSVFGQDDLIFPESIVLETDQTYYAAGDRINYHVFVLPEKTDSDAHPGSNSGVESKQYTSNFAYIDFVDPEGRVLIQQKIKLTQGAGKGDFIISPNLEQGYYRIYAYTLSMKDLDNDRIFSKEIPVYITGADPDMVSAFVNDEVMIFPESGLLLAGKNNRMVYHINGDFMKDDLEITDEDKNSILKIPGQENFGSFQFVPQSGKSYYLIKDDQSYSIPQVLDSGSIIRVNENEMAFQIQIASNKMENQIMELNAVSIGDIVYSTSFGGSEDHIININKADLPTGLINLTLKVNDKICSQRLIYNLVNIPEVKIGLEKTSYLRDENVKVDIVISDYNGEPLESVVTVMVRKNDKEISPEGANLYEVYSIGHQTKMSVSTGLDPGTIDIMDYLITCDYNYREDEPGPIEFRQKINLTVDPGSPGFSEDLSFIASYFLEEKQYTEIRYESGQAILYPPDLESQNHVWFAGFDTFGNQIGEIYASDNTRVQSERTYSPDDKILVINSNEVISYLNQKVKSDAIRQVYGVPATPELIDDELEPDMYIIPDDYIEQSDLREFIVGVIPKTTVRKKKGVEDLYLSPSHTASRFRSPPLYFINEIPTFDCSRILGLALENIDHFEVFNSFSSMASFGIAGRNGVFKVILKEDKENPLAEKVNKMMTINGLAFSDFNSEGFTRPEGMKYPDFRTLLFTSPPMKSDVHGKVICSFNTSDILGTYLIEINGISHDGKFISAKSTFEVVAQ